jgi:acyl carrier protein
LRQVFASGEALKQEHVSSFGNTIHKSCGTKLINLYGPTEATVDVSHYVCTFNETGTSPIPIGKPIDNIRLYVLDASGRLAPIGIAGELHIGGIGVARGYLNNEKLTTEKFAFVPALPGERLYKTGDLARWLPDGNIEYLGRIDEQVKIRGLRIELGEIEHHLSQHPLIRESAVVAKERQGDKFLVAYYVSDTAIEADEIRSFLADKLPDYMVPALYVRLNAIPLTTNGKANKKALPDPEIRSTNNYVAPLGETEQKLVSIWANILHLDENTIGVHHDFFSLGGHSIRAVHLIRAIQKEFSAHIELRRIFENATVKKLARLIESSHQSNDTIIPKAGKRAYYPVSSAQARMFYEHARQQESLTYNISNAYLIKGEPDIEKLKQSIHALVNRHDSLRTCFALSENGLVQTVRDQVNVELTILNRAAFDTDNEAYWHFVQPFDLSEAPLIRFALLTGAGKDNLLFVDVHHIVCDGISLNILMNDFKRLYRNEELPHADLTYVDYACWQNESKVTDKQKDFWMKKLSGQLPVLNLPVMQERDMVDIHSAAIELLEIDNRLYRQIRQFVKAANVTEYMFLLSVYYLLLEKISGDSDIIIGTDVVGRIQPALMDVVGTFVNVLPLRLEIDTKQPFAAFLQTVKSGVLEAFEHQDFQIDQIAAMVQANGNSDRENIIDVHFSYANFIDSREEIATLRFEPVIMERNESTQYELKLQVSEWHDKLILQLIYSTGLYSPDIIMTLMKYYYQILKAVINNDQLLIEEVEIEATAESY